MKTSEISLPYRGSRIKKRRDLLKLICENYLIYYRIREQKQVVEIVAFKHGAGRLVPDPRKANLAEDLMCQSRSSQVIQGKCNSPRFERSTQLLG